VALKNSQSAWDIALAAETWGSGLGERRPQWQAPHHPSASAELANGIGWSDYMKRWASIRMATAIIGSISTILRFPVLMRTRAFRG
jgi:hypothetical protein